MWTERGSALRHSGHQQAFARRELLAIVAAILILAWLFVPRHWQSKNAASNAGCFNQLRHVAVSFNLWAGDHDGIYPMRQLEIEAGTNTYEPAGDAAFMDYFCAITNELGSPDIIACPADTARGYATNFDADFTRKHVSFFVGLDADNRKPGSFLAGDRNISSGSSPTKGVLSVSSNDAVVWTGDLHGGSGNVALSDGSVLQLKSRDLKTAIARTGLAKNRLAMP